MREIALDTETTGLSHRDGHRVVEIGCVELWNYIPTGKTYHTYINPERDVSYGATRVSGLTWDFLKPHPLFQFIAQDFLDFIKDTTLIIHNAQFDIGFLNAELSALALPQLEMSRVIDTVAIARQKFPGSPANLDALCKRFQIDLSKRQHHGALLDAQLLAHVYLELRGGRQREIQLGEEEEAEEDIITTRFPKRNYCASVSDIEEHAKFIKGIDASIWR